MHLKFLQLFLAMLAVVVGMFFVLPASESAAPNPQSTQTVEPILTPGFLDTSIPAESATPIAPSATPTVTVESNSSASTKLNMDSIFPPDPEREVVLYTCTACHTFVRIVLGQRNLERWEAVKNQHRLRVRSLSNSDFDALFAYLEANFNETKPVPTLPDWLLASDSW